MTELMRTLVYFALLVCIPALTLGVQKGISVFVEAAASKIQNDKIERIVREIGSAVADAVADCNQTYVDDLKKAGEFNEYAQKEALQRALSAAIKSLSSDAMKYIKDTYGDATDYLEAKIHATIGENKAAQQKGTH